MSRRRTRQFGDVTVAVAREGSAAGIGSIVIHGEHQYRLPHWPSRFQSIEAAPDGSLNISFTDGSRRCVDPKFDAVMSEAETEWTPDQIGKLRYLVHTFDAWLGDARTTVKQLAEVGVSEPNALYEWVRDQAAATSKWQPVREDWAKYDADHKAGSAPKKAAVMEGDAESRLLAGLPALTVEQLDALVNEARSVTGIEPGDILQALCEATNVPDGLTFADQANENDGDESPNCGTCVNFEAVGQDPDGDGDTIGNCSLFDWPVDDTLTCDAYQPNDDSQNPTENVDNNIDAPSIESARTISAATREKHATVVRTVGGKKKSMFPIFDAKSAKSALKLINHSNLTPGEKAKVRRKAAKFTEMQTTGGLSETFERIFEMDAEVSEDCIAECVTDIREALRSRQSRAYGPLMERWLALHGDGGRVREDVASIARALDRAQSCLAEVNPKPRITSEVERRVIEAQRGVYEPGDRAPLEIAESRTTRTTEDIFAPNAYERSRYIADPLAAPTPAAPSRSSLRESSSQGSGPEYDLVKLAGRPLDDLREQAMDLYERTGGATPAGRTRILRSGGMELAQIIGDFTQDARSSRLRSFREDTAADFYGNKLGGPIITDVSGDPQQPGLAEYPKDTSDDEDLDTMLAISGESFQRFEAALAARVAQETPPAPDRPAVPRTDVAVPGWAKYTIPTSPAMESAALEAARRVLRRV